MVIIYDYIIRFDFAAHKQIKSDWENVKYQFNDTFQSTPQEASTSGSTQKGNFVCIQQ